MDLGRRLKAALDVVATTATIAACAAVVWAVVWGRAPVQSAPSRPQARTLSLPSEPISLEGATRVGSATAKIVLVEYSDFQCPYCARAAQDALPAVIEKYVKAGKVQVVFRHLPLERIHPLAFKAAEAAECAGQQGKFWEMHDVMFANREKLDPASLRAHAASIRLDTSRFSQCFDAGETADKVRSELAEARSMQIGGTPTFILGTLQPGNRAKLVRRASGSTAEQLGGAVDAILNELAQGTLP